MIDFTNCPKIIGRAYNGANGKKIAVEYNGKPYMIKFPPSGADKPTELSYTNSCITELQKEFYKKYIEARYEKILKTAK